MSINPVAAAAAIFASVIVVMLIARTVASGYKKLRFCHRNDENNLENRLHPNLISRPSSVSLTIDALKILPPAYSAPLCDLHELPAYIDHDFTTWDSHTDDTFPFGSTALVMPADQPTAVLAK